VGPITLHIDPTTSPRPETFPPLEFETVTIAGNENILGQAIILPEIDMPNAKIVGGPGDVVLSMKGVPGVALKVFANSATFPDGSKTGMLSMSQVQLDKAPMPAPLGTVAVPVVWTLQPAGVVFDPPAQVTLPNSDALPPGTLIDLFQFDHALFLFTNVGKGTVSEDGLTAVSDPGFGITRTGWGCGARTVSTGGGKRCVERDTCKNCTTGETKKTGESCEPKEDKEVIASINTASVAFQNVLAIANIDEKALLRSTNGTFKFSISKDCPDMGNKQCLQGECTEVDKSKKFSFADIENNLNVAMGKFNGLCMTTELRKKMLVALAQLNASGKAFSIKCKPPETRVNDEGNTIPICGSAPLGTLSLNSKININKWKAPGDFVCSKENQAAYIRHELHHALRNISHIGPDGKELPKNIDKVYSCDANCFPGAIIGGDPTKCAD